MSSVGPSSSWSKSDYPGVSKWDETVDALHDLVNFLKFIEFKIFIIFGLRYLNVSDT